MTLGNIISAIVGGFVGGAFSVFANRSSLKYTTVKYLYQYSFEPLYTLLLPYKTRGYLVEENELESIKSSCLQIIDNSNGNYPTLLYEKTQQLTDKDFKHYCRFIERNFFACQRLLRYDAPFWLYGKQAERVRIICLIAAIILLIAIILMLLFTVTNNAVLGYIGAFLLVASTVYLLYYRGLF